MELWSQSYNPPSINNFGTSHFWTPNTPKPPIQSGVMSASDALQKIKRRKRPRTRFLYLLGSFLSTLHIKASLRRRTHYIPLLQYN